MTKNRAVRSKPSLSSQNRPAVAYLRVSSKDQEKEGFSIPAQRRLLQEYADRGCLLIAKEFVDVETAKQSGRQGFSEMIDFLKRHPHCKVIVVEKTDRLYRNFKDWVLLDEMDAEIHLVKENAVISRDSRSSEKFVHGIKVLMAKNYIDNLSEETRKGMLEKARQGIWPSFAALGYINVVRPDGKRCIELDPKLAFPIRQLFDWFSSGRHTLKDITQMAREAGLSYRKSGSPIVTVRFSPSGRQWVSTWILE